MARSNIGLSFRGVGYDTGRYWEVPMLGKCLMAQRTPLWIPNDFVDGESALFFSSIVEMREKFKKYYTKSDEWMEIARNGQKKFLKFHTPEKRVSYLLDVIKNG